jgi:ATP-dependent DNA helicase RecQ
VPAYVILHDRSRHDRAARRPAGVEERLGIAGIGEAKAARYGADLLAILAGPLTDESSSYSSTG